MIKALQALVKKYMFTLRPNNCTLFLARAMMIYSAPFRRMNKIDLSSNEQEDSKQIQVKAFGKIKIYLADQKQFAVPSESELKKIDAGTLFYFVQ